MRHEAFHAQFEAFYDQLTHRLRGRPLYKGFIYRGQKYAGLGRSRRLQVIWPVDYGRRDGVLIFWAHAATWNGIIDWDRVQSILDNREGFFHFDDPAPLPYWDLAALQRYRVISEEPENVL